MSPKGMRSLRIFTYEDPQSGREEPAVHFSADHILLGQVVAHSGQVLGQRSSDVRCIPPNPINEQMNGWIPTIYS